MRQLNGVYPAIVLNNVDPNQGGRVEIQLLSTGESSAGWARIATLMAGNERGTWFIPDIGDEVLVAFEGGDPRVPYVVGALWNSREQPPEKMDPANDIKTIRSRKGLKVILNDREGQESISIQTPGGQSLELKDGPGAITISDSSGNVITLETVGIRINASAKVSINASEIEINAGALTVNAGLSRFSGVVKCDTLIANSVVGASYTPGAGNLV